MKVHYYLKTKRCSYQYPVWEDWVHVVHSHVPKYMEALHSDLCTYLLLVFVQTPRYTVRSSFEQVYTTFKIINPFDFANNSMLPKVFDDFLVFWAIHPIFALLLMQRIFGCKVVFSFIFRTFKVFAIFHKCCRCYIEFVCNLVRLRSRFYSLWLFQNAGFTSLWICTS